MANQEISDDIAGKAQWIIAKQRNGPTGIVDMAFLDKFARFDNIARGVDL